ncbi:MAG: T9SS type A sorting domain-containing protein [Bacteroidetes bacterium]|nr:T9SS type A sorting domain-containing protein [Bacteroidota bacterium]
MNGVQRRQYAINSINGTMATMIIEGIGHDRGLLERMDLMLDYASELYCYSENGIPVYPLSGAFCLSGLPTSKESLSFQVHPNPSYGTMSISLNENNSKPVTVSLLDVTGRKVYSEQMMVTDGILPFSTNFKGIFQLVIESESNSATRKVVIY